jgi:GR25 family glycosyltransferase involved in LPS biosynthesis
MSWNLDQIPVVCLNLDRRPDRWERVQGSPGFKAFPHIERWSGTDGKTLDIQNDPRISVLVKHNVIRHTRRGHEFINTAGAVGCYLSHASAYEWFAKSNDPVILIFEDDIDLPAGCYEKLKEYIAKTPLLQDSTKWDMWQLGANIAEGSPVSATDPTVDVKAFVLAHAYFVSQRGVKRLLEQIYPLELHVDGYMSYLAKIDRLKIYASPSYLFYQAGSASDIFPGHMCPLCDIPDDFDKHSAIVPKGDLRKIMLADNGMKVFSALATAYALYRVYKLTRK